jgi:hypothetical protein
MNAGSSSNILNLHESIKALQFILSTLLDNEITVKIASEF